MSKRSLLPYVVPTVVAGAASIVGGALISEAWSADDRKRATQAGVVGVGLLSIGAVLAFLQLEGGR